MIPYKIEDPMNLPAKSMTGVLDMEFAADFSWGHKWNLWDPYSILKTTSTS